MSSRNVPRDELVLTLIEALDQTITAEASALAEQAFAIADALKAAGYVVITAGGE